MPKLPVMRPHELVRALRKLGFLEKRQKGSHLIMVHEEKNKQITIPIHKYTFKKRNSHGYSPTWGNSSRRFTINNILKVYAN